MLPKPEILTALLHPITQQDIWARSFWVQPQERSWPMGVATGGRHTVAGASTIPGLRRTVALTGAMVIILMRRLTMITTREPMAGNRVLMDRTGRRRPGRVTIRTREPTLEGLAFRLHMVAEAPHKPIIRTRGPMPKPGKVRVRTLNGVARMFRGETRVLPWVITQRRMERWPAPLVRREEKWPLLVRSGGTVRLVKLPAVICTLGTMVMCIRIRVMAGRNMIMEAGIPSISLSRIGKGQKVASNEQRARAISNGRPQRAALSV